MNKILMFIESIPDQFCVLFSASMSEMFCSYVDKFEFDTEKKRNQDG